MKWLVIVFTIFLIGCSTENEDYVNFRDVEEEAEQSDKDFHQNLYDLTLYGNHFLLDSVSNVLKVIHDDAINGKPYRLDTFLDYDMYGVDTVDINLDGFIDVKLQYMEPGYSFEAWYIWDPNGHYYSTEPFQLQNPEMLDSSQLILYTTELIGMDGDYSSQLLQIIGGTPVSYGRIDHRNIYHDDGDWHNEVHIFNAMKEEITLDYYQDTLAYQGFKLGKFWVDNYLNFIE
ncbi:hypothetical protein [Parvicella tangerina]|uniref:Uncharacterized protein n=1 Tax=Parvicella tangerina TaxID=2829795 RepID=A0A916JQG0_9FLAO|nr:hypothetical protein [Parvicella tangerina]CAG5086423.1 hypothetical protein CRYO30217_03116 [Parvicella tangerina]